jgi:hypothetical protein
LNWALIAWEIIAKINKWDCIKFKKLLPGKRRNWQSEESAYRIGENICKLLIWQEINIPIQKIFKAWKEQIIQSIRFFSSDGFHLIRLHLGKCWEVEKDRWTLCNRRNIKNIQSLQSSVKCNQNYIVIPSCPNHNGYQENKHVPEDMGAWRRGTLIYCCEKII